MLEKLFIYYSNDLHSHFDNWAKLVGYFNDKKQQRRKEGQSHWLVDIGDHVDRSHPIADAMMGKANVELLNTAKYDIATIGNNEGITLDYEELYHLYDEASFDIVCANLESQKGDPPAWLKKTHQVISQQGVTIGFIGLTAPFNAFYHQLGWHVKTPFEGLDESIDELKQTCDIIILLSHLGINEDEEIARRYPDIDVIIGGHTHHLFRHGEYINRVLLTAAGKHGYYAGEVILSWDHKQNKLVNKEAYTIRIDKLTGDQTTSQQIEKLTAQAKKLLSKTVTTLVEPLSVDWFHETVLIKKLVDTLRAWTNADVAMLNAGLLLHELPTGTVSYLDVHRICPHPINPCVVQLTGVELLEVVRGCFTESFMNLQLKGFGFRGEVIGRMVFSGINVEVDQAGRQIKRISINDALVEKDKTYYVATADMFTFGQLLPEIARSHYKKYYTPEFLRDLLVDTLKHNL